MNDEERARALLKWIVTRPNEDDVERLLEAFRQVRAEAYEAAAARGEALAADFERMADEHRGRGLYPEATAYEGALTDAYDCAAEMVRSALEPSHD